MKKIGVLGGGQLGMMLYEASGAFDVELEFLDPDPECSVSKLTDKVVQGSFKQYEAVRSFCVDKDIVTVEIEHIDIQSLKEMESKGVSVYPQPKVLELIQDKGLQKQFYVNNDIPTAPFELLDSPLDAKLQNWKKPFVLKARKGGYDGKGVQIVKKSNQSFEIEGPCLVEELADLKNELAVIVARNPQGDTQTFPVVEMKFDEKVNLVSALLSPADIPESVAMEAQKIATEIIAKLDMVGVLAVEFFWLNNGGLWVNEMAPRPHNSGHQTIEGNKTSQYTQHLKAILGQELGDTSADGVAVMVNLLGSEGESGAKKIEGAEEVDEQSGEYLHDYHKAISKPNRKMGHITVVNSNREKALNRALELQELVIYRAE